MMIQTDYTIENPNGVALKDAVFQTDQEVMVSISSLVFNHVQFIEKALEGFLMQRTNFKVEIVIHDDASTDGTTDILRKYEAQYPHLVKLFVQPFNTHNHPNRFELRSAFRNGRTGKYIALCEGDDYWTDPFKLQKQVDFLEANEEYVMCFHNVNVKTEVKGINLYSDFVWSNIDPHRDVYDIRDVIAGPLIPTCSLVYRKPLDFNIPVFSSQVMSGDMMLAMLITKDYKIKYFNQCWGVYRKHRGGITSTHKGDTIHANRIYLYLRMLEYYNFKYQRDFVKVIKRHFLQLNSLSLLSKEDRKVLKRLIPIDYFLKRIKS